MTNTDRTKAIAIAKLKCGEAVEDISNFLDVSPAIVEEWKDSLSADDLSGKEVTAIALKKASEHLKEESITDPSQLQTKLLNLSGIILGNIDLGISDNEIAKSINTTADTIAKLQNAFCGKGSQIAVINNNGGGNISPDENRLKIFRDTLKD